MIALAVAFSDGSNVDVVLDTSTSVKILVLKSDDLISLQTYSVLQIN